MRQTYTLDESQLSRSWTLDWQPVTITINNTTPYPCYVNVGRVDIPDASSFTEVIAPMSAYATYAAGAREFAIRIDPADADPVEFVYPVSVIFSSDASSVQAPLSLAYSQFIPGQMKGIIVTTNTITPAGSTLLSFANVEWDSAAIWNASNPTELVVPQEGIYAINISFRRTTAPDSNINTYLLIVRNGVIVADNYVLITPTVGFGNCAHIELKCAQNDVFKFYVNSSGFSLLARASLVRLSNV